MGYVIAFGHCISCGTTMGFNPHRVPSIRIDGVREPICRKCVENINPVRIKNGVDPIQIHPEAYEAMSEEEL